MTFGGNGGPPHCAHCDKRFAPGKHYLRIALALDTSGNFLDVPELLLGYEFCTPLCMLHWTISTLPEVLLENEQIRAVYGAED